MNQGSKDMDPLILKQVFVTLEFIIIVVYFNLPDKTDWITKKGGILYFNPYPSQQA